MTGAEEWEAYVRKLRLISNTARLASQEKKSIGVDEMPDIYIFPNNDIANVETSTLQQNTETDDTIENQNNIETLETSDESPVSIYSETIDIKSVKSESVNNLKDSDMATFNDVPESNRVSSIKSDIVRTTLDKDRKLVETSEDIAKSPSTIDDQDDSTKTTETISTPILK